jgi:hypothetical protein
MPTFTSPSGKEYQWNNPNPPTKADIDALVAYDSQLSGQPQSQGPATIAEMRRREEAGQVSALTPAQVQAQVGSPQQLEQAVQDSGKVGQQEGGFMAGLKEVFRGIGSGGSGLAGGEVALAPVGDSPEAKRYREAIAFQARTVPVLGAALSTGGLGAIPTALTMAGTSAVTEEIAQEYEKATGLREKREPGKVVGAGVFGATPGLGPIQGASGPLAAGIWQAGKQALLNASTAALSKTVEKAIDEGRLPTVEELEKTIELPAYLGAGTGFLGGALARGQQPLTTAQQIAQQGREAGQRIEQQVGAGAAPLTGAQQTGINVPGQFREGSAGLAAQQNLVQRIRNVLNLNPQQEQAVGQAVQQEFGAAENVSRQALRQQIQAGQTAVQGEVEGAVRSVIPNAQRAASSEASANNALTAIRQEDQRLSGLVDNAYNTMRTALANRLSGRPEPRVAPTAALGQRIDDLLSTLATEERVTTTPSLIIGGQPTVTVENVPSQFFNEATRRAESLREVARSPQTMEGLVGLRQSIDGLINYFNEFAPGVGQRQLRQLRSALKSEELNAARRLGVESELVAAQNLAEQRFNVLQDNPIIRKAASAAGEGGFQNAETFYSQLASQPEAVASINNLLSTTAQGRIQLNQIRRGLLDSLRSDRPIEIAGQQFENSGSLLNGFRNLPESTQSFIAGNAQNANRLRSILEDANRVQNAGRSIPLGGAISQAALAEITDNIGNINSQRLRQIVIQDAQVARARSEEFFNTTTREVQNNRLNPDVDSTEFVRDFLFRSNNPQVVRNALNQLAPQTRQAVQADAAVALLNHVSETAPQNIRRGVQAVEDMLQDPNRMQIIRETLDPANFNMINDYMVWTRARNLTQQGAALQPNQVADAVMRVSRARWIIDSLVGNPAAQNFMASISRVPRIIGGLKPNITMQQAEALARTANVPVQSLFRTWDDLKQKSDAVRESLPEEKRQIFDDTLSVPARPRF